ncbi:MAG: DUF89 family protein [Deltaproteobacteria bacterium]|nr:DUF89 family protein [Deltaproteobacteria bacterium]MBW2302076.1 DUF89 family protein [Deltaproteobacteria bacterium]
MLIKPDCIPCVLRMSVTAMRALKLDETRMRSLYRRIAELPGLRGEDWNVVSPALIEGVMKIIMKAADSPDPFSLLKWKQNKRVLEVEPHIRSLIHEDADPLFGAIKLAILGNRIDLMVSENPTDFLDWIKAQLQVPVSRQAYADFKERLGRSELLVYLGDNSGEIVFDKLLIEILRAQYPLEVIFVVRSIPTMNDVTLTEAEDAGITVVAQVVENGIMGPFPGTSLKRCSGELRDLLERADIIVSKGGGNFDSLGEETASVTEKTTFMLLSKCLPYCNLFGTGLFDPVLFHIP